MLKKYSSDTSKQMDNHIVTDLFYMVLAKDSDPKVEPVSGLYYGTKTSFGLFKNPSGIMSSPGFFCVQTTKIIRATMEIPSVGLGR